MYKDRGKQYCVNCGNWNQIITIQHHPLSCCLARIWSTHIKQFRGWNFKEYASLHATHQKKRTTTIQHPNSLITIYIKVSLEIERLKVGKMAHRFSLPKDTDHKI